MTNGYKVIDLKGTPIKVSTATKAVVPGIYDAIEESRKPIMLTGIVVNDTTDKEFHPAHIQPAVSGTDYVFTLYGYDMTITDDDEIYYTASESTTLKGAKK